MRDRLRRLMNFSLVAMVLIGILPMANFADEQINQLQENTIDELVSPDSLQNESENEKSDELEETLDEVKPDSASYEENTNFSTDLTNITAENFTVTAQEASALTADQAKTKANVSAIRDNNPVPMDQINVDQAQLQTINSFAFSLGTNPLTFEYNKERVTIIVNVVDENTECSNGICISARPIWIYQSEAGVYNTDLALDRAAPITAWFEDKLNSKFVEGNYNGFNYLTVNSEDIAKVNQITAPNTYTDYQRISVTKNNKTVETKVDVIVDADPEYSLYIQATQNLAYPLSQARSLTSDQIIEDLHAKGCIYIANANGIDVTSSMISKIQADPAVVTQINQATQLSQYDLTFSLLKSESNPIKITIYPDNAETDNPDDKQNANIYLDALRQIDLSTNETPLPGLMTVDEFNRDVEGNIQAVAYHRDGETPVTINITPSSVNNVVGEQTLTVTATDGTNTTTPLQVKVNVKDVDENTVCDGNVCITAKNFKVNLSDIVGGTYTKEQAIKDAKVVAWSQDGTILYDATKSQGDISNVEFDNADFAELMSQTTPTALNGMTFKVVGHTAATNVTATIVNDFTIDANDFEISSDQAEQLTEDIAKQKANVTVSPVASKVEDVVVNATQLEAIKSGTAGIYDLEFTLLGVSKSIKVTVLPPDIAVDGPNQDVVTPEIFITADTQVELRTNNSTTNTSLPTVDEFNADIVSGTHARAWLWDGTPASVVVDPSSEQVLDKAGLYVVRLKGTNNNGLETPVIEVYVSVFDDNTNCNDDLCIAAQDFLVNLSDIVDGTYTKVRAIYDAQVIAWYKYDNVIFDATKPQGDINCIEFDNVDFTELMSQTTATVLNDMTFKVFVGYTASTDVTATIVDNLNYTINANNFAISSDDAKQLTEAIAKQKANVTVSPVASKVQDVVANDTQLQTIKSGIVGIYDLEFTLGENVSKTIKVTVYDDNTNVDSDHNTDNAQIFLTADDQVQLRTNSSITNTSLPTVDDFNADIVAGTNAKAWLLDGTPATVVVEPDSQQVLDKPGLYVVKLKGTNNNGLETSVKDVYVTVVDDNTNCNGDVCIIAKNFTVNLSDILDGTYTKEQAIKDAQVLAWSQDGTVIYDATTSQRSISDVEFDNDDFTQLMSQRTATVLNDMTFKVVGYTASTDVTATIVDNLNYTIDANNFAIHSNDAKQITEDIAKRYASVHVYPVASKVQDVVANATQLEAIKSGIVGIYDLEFTLGENVSKSIKVTVYDDNTNIYRDPDADYPQIFLTADDQVKLRTNSSTTNTSLPTVADFNADIVAGTNAKAWLLDGTPASVVVEPDSQQVLDKPGLYVVKLKGTNNEGLETSVKDVYVTVVDDNTNCNGNVCITAKPITLDLSEVNSYDRDLAITRGEPQAWYTDKADVINQNDINVNSSDIDTVKAQTSATTLTKGQGFSFGGAEARVDVQITDNNGSTDNPDGTVVGPNGEIVTPDERGWVNAYDTTVTDTHAMTLTAKEELIIDMNATAQYDQKDVTPQVSLSDADWASITSGVEGTYPVTFTLVGATRAGGNTASVTRNYTVIKAQNQPVQPEVQPTPEVTPTQPAKPQTPTGVVNNMIMLLTTIALSSAIVIGLRRRK